MWILTFYIELYYINECKNLNHFTCYKSMYDVTYMILIWFVDLLLEKLLWMKLSWHVGECGDSLYYVLEALVPLCCVFLQVVSYIERCNQCVSCFYECACMHGETKSLCRLTIVWFPVERKVLNVVRWLFFKIHITIKWHKVSNVHTTDNLYLHLQSLVNTCFMRCGIAQVDYQFVVWEYLVGMALIFMQYCMSFSIALVPQLLFWHIHWLVSVQSVSDLHWQALCVILHVSWRHCYSH
jgi:hypothetical protein